MKQKTNVTLTNPNNSPNRQPELTGEPKTDFINKANHMLKGEYNITDIYFDDKGILTLNINEKLQNSNIKDTKMIKAILDGIDDVSNIYIGEKNSINVSINYIDGSDEFELKPNKQDELTITDDSSVTTLSDESIMLPDEFGTQHMLLPFLLFSLIILICIFGVTLKKVKFKNKIN